MSPHKDLFSFSSAAFQVLEALESSGYEAWFVGGCVRDSIMRRKVSDVDIATSATWREVAAACEKRGMRTHETGVKHGTVTIVCNDPDSRKPESFEVTTFRVDSPTSRDARHPDSVEFVTSIEQDLLRRDFTINSMAWHPSRGLLDPFGGRDDIASGVIKAVGDPAKRFSEDALRILRACRFSSQLGFTINEGSYGSMLANKHLLLSVSKERITHELDLMLMGDYVHDAIMATADVLSAVVPELVAMKGFAQITKYHVYDVLEHTAWAVQFSSRDRLVRWAALCHDMGKPASAFFDDGGVEHFYGHANVSAAIARGLMNRLLMSSSFKNAVEYLVLHHSDQLNPTPRSVKRQLARADGDAMLFRAQLALKRADILAHAPAYHSQTKEIDLLEGILDDVLAADEAFTVKQLAVNGDDIISLGVSPGPEIGKALQVALKAVIEDDLPNEKKALLEFTKSRLAHDRP